MAGEPINGDPAGQENLVELFNVNTHLQNMHCPLHLRHHLHPHHHHTDDPDHDNCSLVESPVKETESFAIFVELCKSCLAAAALYKIGFINGSSIDDVIIATATNITISNTQVTQYHHQREKNAQHDSSNSVNHDYHHHHQIITVIILVNTDLHTQEDLCETRCVPRSESSTLQSGENQGCNQT